MPELGAGLGLLAVLALVVGGWVLARLVSRGSGWEPAGPFVLLAAAPLVPTVQLFAHLSTDDVLPLLGLVMLVWHPGFRAKRWGRLSRVALAAVVAATIARVIAALVNGGTPFGVTSMLAEAVGRPVVLAATVVLVAATLPSDMRQRVVSSSLAGMGTLEGAFGLIAFLIPLPGGIGVQPLRLFETLGGCVGRVTGTLGLSPNHVGAVFVVTLPMAAAEAATARGWTRWGWIIAVGLQATALVITFTRSSIVLALLAAAAMLIVSRKWAVLVLTAVLSLVLVSGVTAAACPSPSQGPQPSSSSSASSTPTASVGPASPVIDRFGDQSDRPALWYAAVRIMLDHPLAGVGLGQMDAAVKANPSTYRNTPFGVATSSAHNTILLAGAETGVLGAAAMLVLNAAVALMALGWIIWSGGSVPRVAAGFASLAFLAQGMFNNLLTVPATATLLALLIGGFLQERPPGSRDPSSQQGR